MKRPILAAIGATVVLGAICIGSSGLAADLPTVEILATDPTALVGTSSGAFTLVRNQGIAADLVVNYAIGGTGSNGVSYAELPTSATIPAGYLAVDVLVQPLVNAALRGNRTVCLTLQTNENYTLGRHKTAALTLVDDTFNNQPPAVTLTSPAEGATFTLPANITLTAEATDPDNAIARVSFYADDRFLGKATNSPFTLVWSNAPAGRFALFARATDELGKSTLSAAVHITVTNAPPTISLVSPAAGTVFSVPADVTVQAEVADSDDAVAKVQFYRDGRLWAVLTNAPYALVWTNVPPGRHTVSARATDVFGLSATASAQFTVTNAAPSVRLTAPAAGSNFPRRADITLEAAASDSDGGIARVSFYANGRLLGATTNAPYSLVWRSVAPGVYSLRAHATDRYGLKTESEPVLISVSR